MIRTSSPLVDNTLLHASIYVLPTMRLNGVAHVVLFGSSCKVLALSSGRCAKNQSSFGANYEALLRSHNFHMLFRLDWH
jgi:hypothetical protein